MISGRKTLIKKFVSKISGRNATRYKMNTFALVCLDSNEIWVDHFDTIVGNIDFAILDARIRYWNYVATELISTTIY